MRPLPHPATHTFTLQFNPQCNFPLMAPLMTQPLWRGSSPLHPPAAWPLCFSCHLGIIGESNLPASVSIPRGVSSSLSSGPAPRLLSLALDLILNAFPGALPPHPPACNYSSASHPPSLLCHSVATLGGRMKRHEAREKPQAGGSSWGPALPLRLGSALDHWA